jgi:hypothetical protein
VRQRKINKSFNLCATSAAKPRRERDRSGRARRSETKAGAGADSPTAAPKVQAARPNTPKNKQLFKKIAYFCKYMFLKYLNFNL